MTVELANQYAKDDELEIRFYLDSRNPNRHSRSLVSVTDPKTIIKDILAERKYQISHTIDVYAGNDRRKQLNFPNGGAQSKPIYMVKKSVMDPVMVANDLGGYRTALSRETKSKEFTLQNLEATRIKIRASVNLGSWRLDITLVKNATVQNVSAMRTKMIYPITDFIKEAPLDLVDWIEFEFEWIGAGKPTVDIKAMYKVLLPRYNWEYFDSMALIAKMIHHHDSEKFGQIGQGTGFVYLLPKAREVTYDEYRKRFGSRVKSMIIRDKVEGKRQLVWISKGRLRAIDALGFTDSKTPISGDYVFDCELLDGIYYVLHALVWDSMKISVLNDSERLVFLDKLDKLGDDRFKGCPHTTKMSPKDWWNRQVPHKRDGLLLSTDGGYWDQEVIKWKPLSTIDFLAIECPKELEGKAPFIRQNDGVLHLLCMGSNAKIQRDPIRQQIHKLFVGHRGQYQPQLFEPLNKPTAYIWEYPTNLHGEIVELKWLNGWQLEHVRKDKISILKGGLDMGNNIRTVMDTWTKIHKPFTVDMLEISKDDLKIDEKNIDDLIEKVPNDGRVLLYKTSFIPNEFKKILYVASQKEYLDQQKVIEARLKTATVKYLDSDTKFVLPGDFVGGSSLIITTVDDIKIMTQLTAYGGHIILLAKPNAKYTGLIIVESGEDYVILRKENHGRAEMTVEDIHKENPHLVGCKAPSFASKFMRQKTKEIITLTCPTGDCKSLPQNPNRGDLLCDMEFLSQLGAGSQVYYHGVKPPQLPLLFPELKWVDVPSKENVEYLISHDDNYDVSEKMIVDWNPVQSLIRVNPKAENRQYLRGKMFFIPFQPLDGLAVMMQVARRATKQFVMLKMYESEMAYYHKVYRCSGFKFHPSRAGYDNCYDCRSEIYIITKYIRSQKNMTFDSTIQIIGTIGRI